MANLSPETLDRLNKFIKSDKYSSLNPETQSRLSGFIEQKQPGFIDKLTTTLSRPGASVRERVRVLGQTGDINQANQAADLAFKNPASSETFQNQVLRQTNELLPQNAGVGTRFAAGLLPSVGGLIQDVVSDPVQLALGLATEGTLGALSPLKYKGLSLGTRASKLPISKILSSAEGQATKASNLFARTISPTEKLLKPSGNFAQKIEQGVEYNPTEQASKFIRPAKNYTELTDQMRLAKGFSMEERAKLFQGGVLSKDRSQLSKIADLIDAESQSAQGSRNAKVFKDIRKNEFDFLNRQNPEALNSPEFYQSRKEYYQKLANDAGAYKGSDARMTAKADAYRALADGYQNKTYAVDGLVRPLNLENAGLSEAQTRFSELAATERGQAPPTIAKEIVESIRPTKLGMITSLVRKFTGDSILPRDVVRFSKEVSILSDKARKAQELSGLLTQLATPESASISYPKQLPAPAQKMLGQNRKSIFSSMLPKGQGSGPTINVPGSSTIYMPEVLESDLLALSKKWGVPERNIREIIKAVDIEPVVKSSSTESLIMSKKLRKNVADILNRRKRNFQNKVL